MRKGCFSRFDLLSLLAICALPLAGSSHAQESPPQPLQVEGSLTITKGPFSSTISACRDPAGGLSIQITPNNKPWSFTLPLSLFSKTAYERSLSGRPAGFSGAQEQLIKDDVPAWSLGVPPTVIKPAQSALAI